MSHRFQINLRGIIELLSNHLYSRREVFVRELLQNAVDAITARRLIEPGYRGEVAFSVSSPPGGPPTLEAADDGIGLTEEEIHRFLATIGETSKRGPDGRQRDDFLGQFGIGLLSCFVVSDEIVVITRSAREAGPAVEWRGQADGTYSVRTLDLDVAPGTKVYLTCRADRRDLFRPEAIKELARRYGGLLPFPIRVSTGRTSVVVNEQGAPWRREYPHEKARLEALLRYGKQAFDTSFLDAIPLRSEVGKVDGVALVLPHPVNLGARRGHRVYLRNMLLSEEADNLLPDWAFFVKAVLNADDLRPTASREGFFEDDRLAEARVELGRCLREHLVELSQADSRRFERFVAVHQLALKALAAEDDECYRQFVDWLPFETTQGSRSVRELRATESTIRYADDVGQYGQLSKVAIAQGLTLVNAGYVYEADLLARLPDVYPDLQVERVDSESLAQHFDDLDLDEQDEVHDLLQAFERALKPFRCRPEVRKFEPSTLPTLFYAGAEAKFHRSLEQSRETADPLFQGVLEGLRSGRSPSQEACLALNYRNDLVRKLAATRSRAVLERAAEALYVQSLLLAQQPLVSKELDLLTRGLAGLIELASERATDREAGDES